MLEKEAELGTQRFLLAPGWEKGVPPLAGVLGKGWDLCDPSNAAQDWVFLKAPLWISGMEITIKIKDITDYCISKGEKAGYQLCLKK